MTLTYIQDNIIPVFCAYEVHDEYGRHKTLMSIHRNRQEAEFAIIGKGWYGGSGDVQHKHAIEDGLDLYLLEGYTPTCFADVTEQRAKVKAEKIAKALAKLTPEEIELIKGEFK